MNEVFDDVPGFEGLYTISNYGRIVSIKRRKYLKARRRKDGYYMVKLFNKGKKSGHLVHRLVLLTFKGPSDMVTRHLDGDQTNNHIDNLEYGTMAENVADQKRHNTFLKPKTITGTDVWCSKLNTHKVNRIREYATTGSGTSELARLFGVTPSTISKVILRQTWSDLS